MAARDRLATSVVGAVELVRAARRLGAEPERVLETVVLIELTDHVREVAGQLEPPTLRSLDAIHLASALSLGDDLEALATYDERLANAAEQVGVLVLGPTP